MTDAALAMTADLAAQLAAPIDTKTVAIRNSHLKAMSRSAAHCLFAMRHDSEPTLSKRIGSGVHSLLLGGPPVLLYPGKQRRGKDYDAWREDKPADAIVFTRKDYDRSHRIADAVRRNKQASQVLFAPGSIYEQTILWSWLGRARRCTPDVRTMSHLVELKSTRNASPEKFKWDVLRYGYHAQLADYANAIETTTGIAPKDVYTVAVETTEPYLVAVYRLTANDLEQGARLCRAWMERLLVCEEGGTWPGYCEVIQDLDLPNPDGDFEFQFGDDEDSDEKDE